MEWNANSFAVCEIVISLSSLKKGHVANELQVVAPSNVPIKDLTHSKWFGAWHTEGTKSLGYILLVPYLDWLIINRKYYYTHSSNYRI